MLGPGFQNWGSAFRQLQPEELYYCICYLCVLYHGIFYCRFNWCIREEELELVTKRVYHEHLGVQFFQVLLPMHCAQDSRHVFLLILLGVFSSLAWP